MGQTLIIGAGAAGLAAGSTLEAAGQAVTLLEARNRLGGRVWTDRSFSNFPIENGAEFIHGDRALTWQWVRELGAETIPVPKFSSYAYEQDGTLYRYEDVITWPDLPRVFGLEDQELATIDPLAADRSLQTWLSQLGLTPQAQRIGAHLLANLYLAAPEHLGVADWAHEMRVHHAGTGNFRLRDGYDHVLHHLAQGLTIHQQTAVQSVRWDVTPLEIRAIAQGQPVLYTADQVVITVPLALLQQQTIDFTPALPTAKQQAIQALRMGPAVKLQLAFRECFWEPEVSLYMGLGTVPVWWSPSYQRPDAHPVLTAFVGGARALALNAVSEAEALQLAVADLCRLFGSDRPRQDLVKGRRISWIDDPWTRGGL
ncbi:hypothetical protein DO97_20980 [Neosynechococcus sphagnicola sy1]|uniref:Amine oxidase domain-containing protein n=1 Tax=Neosynechococcus sphagnicola sy1 TaxID=1497020 RepID=A0A098TN52_9CYAN|nr:NAD(P)/FAD-dependent oxidoreductase [Neosynechococcus sphagnicola]KGF73302.1 hypothetical protein DO97_20980 [Neosynechococcus sphagnicola sy1]